jgi:cysteine desulfurase
MTDPSKPVIYLDNNATTMVAPEVVQEMMPYLEHLYGNPSSMHSFGGSIGRVIELARGRIAAAINAEPEEIIFTSCGTEADNAAIHAALEAAPEKRRVVTTRVEHPAVLNYAKHLERKGFDVVLLPVDDKGRLDMDRVSEAITPETAVVSVMWANNETGTVFPVEDIAGICAERGVPFHTDGVQAVGKLPVDVKASPIDYMALSGHKVHAPKGVGALYVRKGAPFRPFLIGGHQEHGRRGGTENTASIVALGKAVELAVEHLDEEATTVRALRDRLEHGLMNSVPDTVINGDPASRLPNTLSIAFKHIEGEAMLLMMDEFGICASSGSACTSGSLEPSHVLRAMGVPFTFAHGSLRFSLSRYTTDQDIDTVLENLPGIIERLRVLSPFGKEQGVACAVERTTQ